MEVQRGVYDAYATKIFSSGTLITNAALYEKEEIV